MNQEFWDARYGEHEAVWSGRPNGALTVEASGLRPGQALDVGCGEGGDALWLAAAGWRVTATDISRVALERAAERANGADIAWVHGDLAAEPPSPRTFDLVSALYFPLPKNNPEAARGLIDSVAAGGILLYVGHDLSGFDADDHDHDWDGPDPRDYFTPADVAELLDVEWEIEVNEARPRVDTPEVSAHFVNDLVLRARRVRS
ncbi:class I SAM-dependent methyltransferase [Solicola gregarius]|uniref:Class I SAM-dependent methyltransferase n=1 Tax=Solicola gregarius TaxID=2908642 RepID=A0AA46YN71_9ACTN|nr:class I SAM-dependent methyltransferase [Solicola gregarius]UYM07304.1 class I SAM-dependent methyltransferase [Solicola gregarius]